MDKKQIIKSKKRTIDFGEVFTSKREVNAMLDLLNDEATTISSKFLEPACGNGNFLSEIFNRKMEIVIKKYKKNQEEFEQYSILAISSLYGIDILEDNVIECRNRLLSSFSEIYQKLFKNLFKKECLQSAKYILEKNIVLGDALSLKKNGDKNLPIVFSEWSFVNSTMIKRRDYTLANLIEYRPFESDTLFSDAGEEVVIPNTVKEYPILHFLEITQHG